MSETLFTVGSVTVPESLLLVTNVQWIEQAGKWVLMTWQGQVIGTFASEDEVARWWEEFLQFPARVNALAGRNRRLLAPGIVDRPIVKARNVAKRSPSRSSYGPPIKDDPLMPWNKEFDMPDFDAS